MDLKKFNEQMRERDTDILNLTKALEDYVKKWGHLSFCFDDGVVGFDETVNIYPDIIIANQIEIKRQEKLLDTFFRLWYTEKTKKPKSS